MEQAFLLSFPRACFCFLQKWTVPLKEHNRHDEEKRESTGALIPVSGPAWSKSETFPLRSLFERPQKNMAGPHKYMDMGGKKICPVGVPLPLRGSREGGQGLAVYQFWLC